MITILFSQDMIFCRRYRGLEHRITHEGKKAGLVCQIRYWAGAWEVEELFKQLPDTVETD
jgi:pyridoxal phosphate phosphatase PHOSPHO2